MYLFLNPITWPWYLAWIHEGPGRVQAASYFTHINVSTTLAYIETLMNYESSCCLLYLLVWYNHLGERGNNPHDIRPQPSWDICFLRECTQLAWYIFLMLIIEHRHRWSGTTRDQANLSASTIPASFRTSALVGAVVFACWYFLTLHSTQAFMRKAITTRPPL